LQVTDTMGNVSYDSVLVDVQVCTGMMVSTPLNHKVRVYPNPADDILYIEFSNKTNHIYTLSIFDVLGKEILHQYINAASKSSIDIRELQAGMYFFNISINNQTLEKGKFIKR